MKPLIIMEEIDVIIDPEAIIASYWQDTKYHIFVSGLPTGGVMVLSKEHGVSFVEKFKSIVNAVDVQALKNRVADLESRKDGLEELLARMPDDQSRIQVLKDLLES